ncbi:MAG: hypothetical protein U5K69_25860 [Balneolaceae bacterium]|nr:hypothetical protein [Balneolaceae bacterium]
MAALWIFFSDSGEYPVRLEFFGNEVDSIRQFDPDSQRSISYLNTVRIVPDATNLNLGDKENLLTYFDEDTLFIFFNQSLIKSDIEEHFNKAEVAYKDLDDTSGQIDRRKRLLCQFQSTSWR